MKSPRALLAIYGLEAFLAFLWTLLTPSEAGHAVLLSLSRGRLVLAALALLVWLVTLALTLIAWRAPARIETLLHRLDILCTEQNVAVALVLLLLVPPLLVLIAALAIIRTPLDYPAYRSWAPDTFPLLHSLTLALLPLLLLACIVLLEFGAYCLVRYRRTLSDPHAWSALGPSLLLLFAGTLTAFYWLVLIFRLRFFVNNPAWYWKFDLVAFHPGDLLLAALAVGLLCLAWWLLFVRRRILPGLLALFVLGLALQFGVGLMSGGGLAYFRDRYFSTYHKTYITKAAAANSGLIESIRGYEKLFGSRQFTNTKPPGLMAFYIALDHAVNGFPSSFDEPARYERLSAVVTAGFPILALLLIGAVYAFARRYAPGALGWVPSLAAFLLVLCPNFILFSLFPDQSVYPLLFLLGIWLVVIVIGRQSLPGAFLLGLFLYLAVFFAFTMLPLFPFVAIYLVVDYWLHRHDRSLGRQISMALALAAGTLALYLLFRLALNYDFLPRFGKAVAINHNFDFYLRVGRQPPSAPESPVTRLLQIAGAAWLNNLDFAAAMGFPIYILFVLEGFALIRRLWSRCVRPGDPVLGALFLSFVVLNLAGTAQGEVPRLWLFWLPVVVTLAAIGLEPWAGKHPKLLLGIGITQLITLFLTFHFQDLRM